MKTRFFVAMSAVLALGLAACQKEEAPEAKQETKTVTTITASIDGTKTAVEGDGRVTWSQGDQIAVKCGENFGVFTLKDEYIGQTSASFEGDPMEFPEGATIEAYYPATVYDNATSKCAWPSEQTYSENAGCPMYSTAVVTEEGKSPILTFSNLGSILRLKIAAATGDHANVTSIKISSSNPIAGEFTVADAGDGKYKAVLSSSDVKSITLDCGESGIDGTKYFNVAVPANVDGETKYEGFNVDVETREGKFIATASKPLPKSLVRNTVYTVSIADNWGLGGANCYIVAPNKTYTMRVDRMGNSDGSDPLDVLDTKGAKIVWETFNTTIAPDAGDIIKSWSFDAATKRITFTTNENLGNAYIAATSEADGAGDILWGWHLWVVEGGEVPTISSSAKNITFQAYDLGATAAGGYPLQVQGQRHCPVIGVCGTYDEPVRMASTPAPADVLRTSLAKSEDRFGNLSRLNEGIKNSGQLIGEAPGSSASTGWCFDGYSVKFWNKDVSPCVYNGKCLFDPCPAGYALPTTTELQELIWSTPQKVGDIFTYNSGWVLRAVASVSYCSNNTFFFTNNNESIGYRSQTIGSGGTCTIVVGPNSANTKNLTTNYSDCPGRVVRCVRMINAE